MVKFEEFMWSYHKEFPCKSQTESFSAFLAYHIPRAMHFPEYKILPWFVEMLYFSLLSLKFQPTECIIFIDFDHFSGSLNYVRGVTGHLLALLMNK